MKLKHQNQLAGQIIHLRKKNTGKWKAFIPLEPQVTGEGNTVIEAIQVLTIKLSNISNDE